jgi:hypothetical protein
MSVVYLSAIVSDFNFVIVNSLPQQDSTLDSNRLKFNIFHRYVHANVSF